MQQTEDNIDYKFALNPMRFNALVLETTTRCNAKCAMCYQSSGPKGHDEHGIAELNTDALKTIISDAMKVPNLYKKLHVAGGEAFINENLVFEVLDHGQKVGFQEITMTTNAYWGSSDQRAERICRRLVECGMTEIEISWDFWHLQYIDPKRVVRVLEACQQNDISTTLRLLTTKFHYADEALELLGDGWKLASRILWGTVFATGRAETDLEPDEVFPGTLTKEHVCGKHLNLVVNANGEVFPCCAGMDQTVNPKLGNIKIEPIHEVAKRMSENLWIRKLVFDGVISMEELVREDGYCYKEDENAGMCTRCWKLFSDEKATEIVKKKGIEIGKNILQKTLRKMEVPQ